MTGWEPATEAEVAMRDALHAQDQQQYFRVLAHVDLVLPVAGGSTAGWGTWTSGGRTHVLAFTSVAALRASLGENAGATRRVPYVDLAAGWPDPEWWLAVNPGLPIEGYLPAWYVAQLSRGDVRLPGRTMGARARLQRVESATRAARNGTPEPAPEAPTVPVPAASVPAAPVPPPSVPPPLVPPPSVPPPSVPPPSVPPSLGPPPSVPRGRGGWAAEPDEPATVPMRTAPGPGRRVPTVPPRRPRPAAGDGGDRAGVGEGADSDALDGWLTDLRHRPDEPDPFAAGRAAAVDETPTVAAPPPARSFFEPTSGRPSRRSSPLDTSRRSAERGTPPSRFAGGQPFPRRRPLNEPVPEDPTRAFPTGADVPTPAPRPADPAPSFRPARPAEDPTRTLPRRQPAPAASAPPDEWAPTPADRWESLDAPAETEELPPSIVEPVSAPPASRRDFTPIVIEGTVIEARDLTIPGQFGSTPPAADGYAAGPAASWATPSGPTVPRPADPPVTSPVGAADLNEPARTDDRPTAESLQAGPFGPEPSRAESSRAESLRAEPFGPEPSGAEPATATSGWPDPPPKAGWAAAEPGDLTGPPVSSDGPTVSLFQPTTPLSEPAPAEPAPAEPTPTASVADERTASLFEPVSPAEPTVPLFAPSASGEPTTALFAPASPGAPSASLFDPVASSGEPTVALSEPASPGEPTASLFDPVSSPDEPTVSLFEPASPDEPTTALRPPASPAEPTVPLFASASPDEPTTALFTPASPGEPTTAHFAPGSSGEPTASLFAPSAAPTEPPHVPGTAERTVDQRVTAPRAEPAEPDFVPANTVEEELLAATGSGNADGFLTTLLLARVMLPVAFDSAPGSRPGDPGFAWRTETVDGVRYVAVYTSPERLAEHTEGPVDTIRVKFVQLIRCWPDENWSFLINPGSLVGAAYPGEQVLALANWAAEVGLGDDPETEPEPSASGPAPAAEPRRNTAATPPSPPVTMQKAVAASQLAYYLERGYDRVSGFVHRAGELAHLRTPAELYDALGLGHPGSPFSRADEELYLLRWPAYRPSLYRIPYGGQNEAAMRAMEGWVIERPPFRGNGFAPSENSDVIAEFKVDSARLPHGAQLWRIGADGDARLVATLDTDALRWQKADQA
ncbi:SseB family protein [Micromonospora sp. WMMD1128]|uniref:SseB family protein n=1 Tax=Micromonospora sp. WMMD1128 TaxID=3015150 RepID=UPI0032B2E9F3